jgi:hypothetical protein
MRRRWGYVGLNVTIHPPYPPKGEEALRGNLEKRGAKADERMDFYTASTKAPGLIRLYTGKRQSTRYSFFLVF